jgi:hypothetical protein
MGVRQSTPIYDRELDTCELRSHSGRLGRGAVPPKAGGKYSPHCASHRQARDAIRATTSLNIGVAGFRMSHRPFASREPAFSGRCLRPGSWLRGLLLGWKAGLHA